MEKIFGFPRAETPIILAAIIAIFFVLLAILFRSAGNTIKKFLFAGIAVPIVLVTLYLTVSTISLNINSATGGPVHWHADFEIWDCGQKLDLIDPKGLSNRVGTPVLHEHGDNRIHVEGVVVDKEDVSLGKFFKVVDGKITNEELELATNSGKMIRQNGDQCPNGTFATLQVFIYKTQGNIFNQQKLSDIPSYVLSPFSQVPPGDCVIIEFDIPKDKTDKLCNFYKIAKDQGKIHER